MIKNIKVDTGNLGKQVKVGGSQSATAVHPGRLQGPRPETCQTSAGAPSWAVPTSQPAVSSLVPRREECGCGFDGRAGRLPGRAAV